jgi:hypothetical protein
VYRGRRNSKTVEVVKAQHWAAEPLAVVVVIYIIFSELK